MFQSQFSSGIAAKKKIANYTVKSKIYHCISLSCDVHTHAYNVSVNNHEAHLMLEGKSRCHKISQHLLYTFVL